MGKESLREHIFKKWQAKFPDKFPPDKPLSAYIELDEDTGEPLCGRLTGCLSTGREITETATRVASPVHRNNGHVYSEYKYSILKGSWFCPVQLALFGHGETNEVMLNVLETEHHNEKGDLYACMHGTSDHPPIPEELFFEGNQLCPLFRPKM